MKQIILSFLLILLLNLIASAQFYIDYNLGYDISLSKFKKDIELTGGYPYQESENPPTWEELLNPFFQNDYQEMTKTIQFLPIGNGMSNNITFGYKCNSLFSLQLNVGSNSSSLQLFNNAISHSCYTEPIVRVYNDTTWLSAFNKQFFDQYLNVEETITEELTYSYFYFSPEVSISKNINKFNFELLGGIGFYFFHLQSTHTINWDIYSASKSGSFTIKTDKQMANTRPVVSYNLGIKSSYSITDKLALLFQIKYTPVKYQPTECISTETVIQTDNEKNTITESQTFENQQLKYNQLTTPEPYRVSLYNFQSLNASIGIRYLFMSQKDNH